MARTLSTRRKKMAGMDNRRTDGRREDGKTLWYAARVVTWEPEVEEEEEEEEEEEKRGKKREKEGKRGEKGEEQEEEGKRKDVDK